VRCAAGSAASAPVLQLVLRGGVRSVLRFEVRLWTQRESESMTGGVGAAR
jgi:hypothetical protein